MARQRRELGATWPVDLTPGGVRMLEVELGGAYSWSLDRLKRRCLSETLRQSALARACRMQRDMARVKLPPGVLLPYRG